MRQWIGKTVLPTAATPTENLSPSRVTLKSWDGGMGCLQNSAKTGSVREEEQNGRKQEGKSEKDGSKKS